MCLRVVGDDSVTVVNPDMPDDGVLPSRKLRGLAELPPARAAFCRLGVLFFGLMVK